MELHLALARYILAILAVTFRNVLILLFKSVTFCNRPSLAARARLCRGRRIDHALGRDHDAVVAQRRLDRDHAVEHIVDDVGRIALQRIAVTAARRAVADEAAVLANVHVRHLRRQCARRAAGLEVELGWCTFAAAQESPRAIAMTFAFDRRTAVAQERELAHRPETAAPLARARHVLA